MAFLRAPIHYFTWSSVFIFLLFLFGCQEKGKTKRSFFSQKEERQQAVVPAAYTPDSARLLTHRLDSAFTYLHKKKGFNGAVLVSKYDSVLYKNVFGKADFYRKDSLTLQTAFQLASVSKQFTAMAIMLLHEDGELQYDDSVQLYLPNFPYRGITIRQLLTHQSGLSNYTYFSDKLWPDRKNPLTNQDVVNLMVTHQPKPYFKPNVRFDYSNTGYSLLASIVEAITEKPFAHFLQERIFEPLEMTHTFTYSPDLATLTGAIATGHNRNRQKRTTDYLDTVLGDKGVYSTVEDLYKWDQALYTNKLVSFETLKEAFTSSRPSDKKLKEGYGFGWRIKTLENGDTAVYHGGLWHGFSSYFLRNPKDHSTIILLSNLPNSSMLYLKEVFPIVYPPSPEATKDKKKNGRKASVR